jgi:hypothetical protein
VKKKIELLDNEEKRRAKEETRLEEEHQQKKQQTTFDEWKKTREEIKGLRRELLDDSLEDDARDEVLEDIARLAKRKKQLTLELGLD